MNRLHPLTAVMMALNRGVSGAFLAFVLVTVLAAVFDLVSGGWTVVAAPLGFALGAAYGITYYSRFEYELTADTFDLASGVFSRRDREIPYHRVQNVDVRQGVVFRLFGLAVVNVETAGGGATEAVLNFVSEDEADRLQREIRRRTAESKARRRNARQAATGAQDETDEAPADVDAEETTLEDADADRIDEADLEGVDAETTDTEADTVSADTDFEAVDVDSEAADEFGEVEWDEGPDDGRLAERADEAAVDDFVAEYRPKLLFRLDSRELLLYSLASFRLAAAAGVVFIAFLAAETALEFLLTVSEPVGGPADLATATPRNYVILSLVSFVHLVVFTYLLGAGYTFVSYYGFRLGRAGDDLVYERGLLQNYSGSIPVEKVQSVTVTDNPIQRLIGYAGLWVETAGYGPDSSGGSQSAVPLAKRGRVYGFAERFTDLEKPSFHRPTTVARRRYLVRYSLVAGAVVLVAYGITLATPLEAWYYATVVFLAVPVAAHLRWVHLGYYVGTDHLVIRSGFWRRQTTVIPYYRVQTINNRRSIFQRRLGLASLVVDTASSQTFFRGTPTIYDVNLEVAREVHDESREKLQVAIQERSGPDAGDGTIEFV
ncbi:PH domain-containing protein [Natronobeatus ordinarius]|uniref:PH domain-containing protein n=1 Tax=Natronobeatus ordinarius TaxID=2963433 RepID=UPI0020CD796B|nr:PH domain-containing protein [Natronobeatus ordinarius]